MAATSDSIAGSWALSGLEDLLQRLRRATFPISTSETIDATRLLKALAEHRPDITHASALKAPLRAVLCKSAAQQRQFDPIFDEWLRQRLHREWKPEPSQVPASASVPSAERGSRRSRWLLPALGALLALVLVVLFLWWRSAQPVPGGEVQPPPSPAIPSAGAAAPPIAAAPAPRDDDIRIYGYFPVTRYQFQIRPLWLWLLLGVPFVLLLAFETPPRLLRGGRSRSAGNTVKLEGWSRHTRAERIVLRLSDETSGRLLRHLRGPASELKRLERRPQFHVRRTVEATFRNLGIPALRFRDARLVPSYLILVEAETDDELAVHWAERLAQEGMQVDLRRITMRDGEPRIVRLGAPAQDEGQPLEALPSPPYGQRLVVVSDGEWMADAQGQRTAAAQAARFARWPRRVFFTSLEPRRWGKREDAIEQPERTGDPGFLLLPIDENALDAWSKLLVSGKLPDIELESPQHFPRLVHDLGEEALLADTPPGDLAVLIAQLKRYLGPNGFFWLCCCAVPPVMHPQLTLVLGESFLLGSGAEARDLPRYLARNYRLLLRLPWVRRSSMPVWLRVTLLASLSLPVQQEVRNAVERQLARQRPDAEGNLTLAFEPPPGAAGATRSSTDESGDLLYLGFLGGMSPAQLSLRMPGEWERWLAALQPPRAGWRGWMDRLAARWQRLRYVRGLALLGPRRWARWAAGAWLLAMALGAGWLLQQPASQAPFAGLFQERGVRVQLRHTGALVHAAFSPDGKRIVTASWDNTARVWDAASGSSIGPLKHDGRVNHAAFSPDGARIVTASWDNTARVWDAASGAPIGAPLKHDDRVNHAAFSPDGARIVTASSDRTARVWDATSGAPISPPLTHNVAVVHAAFSPDGARIVSAGGSTARIWDAASGASIGAPLGHLGTVVYAAFSPDGARIVTVGFDNAARVWDAASGASIGATLFHGNTVLHAAFSPDGSRIVTASEDKTARIWDAASGAPIGAPLRHDGSVRHAAFSPDGTRIVSASNDRTARVWDAASGAPIGVPLKHDNWVYHAAFSPDGTRIATASFDRTARVWDAAPAAVIGAPLRHDNAVTHAAFSPDGARIVSASADNTARLWDAVTGAAVGAPLRHEALVFHAAFSPDGSRIVTTSVDNTARVWNAGSGAPIGAPLRHDGTVIHAAFSPDGARIVTASWDKTARVWDTASGAPIGVLLKHESAVNHAAFSPDGLRIITASSDSTARVWDAASGAPIGVPLKHDGAVYRAAFSPDGSRIVTASLDNTACVWDAASGVPIGVPLQHENEVNQAAFSPDGARILTASGDSTARVWDAASGAPIGAPLKHDGAVEHAAFSPDGSRIVTASVDNTARVWDAGKQTLLAVVVQSTGPVYSVQFSPGGERIVVAVGSRPGAGTVSPAEEQPRDRPDAQSPPGAKDQRQQEPPRIAPATKAKSTPAGAVMTAVAALIPGTIAHAAVRFPPIKSAAVPRAAVPNTIDRSRAKQLAGNAAYVLSAPQTDEMLDRTATTTIERWLARLPLSAHFVALGFAVLVAGMLALWRRRARLRAIRGGIDPLTA